MCVPAHAAPQLLLLYLQLGQKVNEPLKTRVVPVDPEEVDLLQIEHVAGVVIGPGVVTLGTVDLVAPVSVHDGLEDGGEWRDTLTQMLVKFTLKCFLPIPVPMRTACSALVMLLEGEPNGPSTNISRGSRKTSFLLFVSPSLVPSG